jgi:hypothetical protein
VKTDNGPYRTTVGDLVASSKADLVDGYLSVPIERDEDGTFVFNQLVWANSYYNGTYDGGFPCAQWTSSSDAFQALVGFTCTNLPEWTQYQHRTCENLRHVYCIQQ